MGGDQLAIRAIEHVHEAVLVGLDHHLAVLDPLLGFGECSRGAGNETAVLYGDPDKPGFYVLMFKWLPGRMSRPHWHPHDRMITVFKGTWWVGTGEKFDPDSTVPLPVGSYVTHFGKEIHWDGAKNEEVWLLMSGEGPATSTPASTPPPVQ